MSDAEVWAALRSPEGFHGYTVSAPDRDADLVGVWHCILAILDDDFATRYWDVYGADAAGCQRKAVTAVLDWTQDDGTRAAGAG